MNSQWAWHDFAAKARDGAADSTVVEMAARSRRPVIIRVDAWEFNHVPKLDEDRPTADHWSELIVVDGSVQPAVVGGRVLRPLAGSRSLAEMVTNLEQIDGIDYYWIDLGILVALQRSENRSGDWGAVEIWDNALEPWNHWCR
jgi:hypothetical protein